MLEQQLNEIAAIGQEFAESVRRRMSFNKKQQADLLSQFAKPMSVGRKPVTIAQHIAKYGDKQQRIIATDIEQHLQSGLPMTSALAGWYDSVTVSALAAAEQAGSETLVQAMDYLSENLVASQKTKAAIMGKWAYPGMFIVVSIIVIMILNDRIVPLYRSLIDGRPDPTLDRFEAMANFYKYWFWLVVALVIGAIFYARWWLRNVVGPVRDTFDDIALFSGYRLSVGAHVVSIFALLKRFGMSGYKILGLLSTQGSAYQQYHVFEMKELLRDGGGSEIEALDSGLLDEEYIAKLRLYAEASEEHVVTAMEVAAEDIEDRVLKKVQRVGNIVYYALWFWLVSNLVTIISLMLGFNP